MKETTWRLERFDSSWGGWKPVPKAFNDDSPVEFPSRAEATAALREAQQSSAYQYRLREVVR